MRPQQQNRRMRGRNNNNNNNNQNRKGPNPLTRSYESNGPDVKIRGSAQQIADKYMQLARDAQGSGDRVMAENYLQHAEHYNRIIAAAQAQMPQQFVRDQRDDMDDDEEGGFDGQQQPFEQRPDGTGPQPEIGGIPAEVALNPDASNVEQPREQRPVNGNYANGQNNGGQQNAREGEEGGQRRPRRRRGRRPDGDFRNDETNASGEGQGDGDDGGLPSFVTAGRTPPAEAPAPAKADRDDEQQPADAVE